MVEPTQTDCGIDTVLVPLGVSTAHHRTLVFPLAEK